MSQESSRFTRNVGPGTTPRRIAGGLAAGLAAAWLAAAVGPAARAAEGKPWWLPDHVAWDGDENGDAARLAYRAPYNPTRWRLGDTRRSAGLPGDAPGARESDQAGRPVRIDRAFPPDAAVDVTAAPYSVPADGERDATDAIQRAVTENVDTGRALFFPPGVYRLSRPIVAQGPDGRWKPRLVVQGAGAHRTVFRLADRAPGFGDPGAPRALFATGSLQQDGDAEDGGGNKAFGNSFRDLTIFLGHRNPGAAGIDWAVSNYGTVNRVRITAPPAGPDGGAAAGIRMRRRIPGPGYIRDVLIENCAVGLDVDDMQYGVTVEDFAVVKASTAAVRLGNNLIHMQGAVLDGPVLLTHPQGALTLRHSWLEDARHLRALAETPHGFLDLFGVSAHRADQSAPFAAIPVTPARPTHRFTHVVRWETPPGDAPVPAPPAWWDEEWFRVLAPVAAPLFVDRPPGAPPLARLSGFADAVRGRLGAAPRANPARTAPLPAVDARDDRLDDWTAVGPRLPGEDHDGPAIQRAVDAGRPTVYFPMNRLYCVSDTVVLRGAVRRVLGMGAEISCCGAAEAFGDPAIPRPLFRIETTGADALFLEDLFINAQYPGVVAFENASSRDVVFRHIVGWVGQEGARRSYRDAAGAGASAEERRRGRVFIEDVFMPGWHFTGREVWARQFNPEDWDGDGARAQVVNDGGRLWILGFKTEGPAPFVETIRGDTEIWGGYNYLSAAKADPLPAASVPYPVRDGRLRLTVVTENFRPAPDDYAVYLRDRRGAAPAVDTPPSALLPRDGQPAGRSRVALGAWIGVDDPPSLAAP